MTYQHQTGKFYGTDGTALFYQCWLAGDVAAGRNLVIHHGISEHSGRYEPVVRAFEGENVNIFAFDARGHGRSGGKRGDARGLGDLIQDLECFLEFLKHEFGVRQPILLGHSLGGVVAVGFTLQFSNQWHLQGLVTSGAGLRPHLGLEQKIKTIVGRLLRPLVPTLTLPLGLPVEFLSHDTRVVQAYTADPFNHGVVSVRMGLDLIESGPQYLARAEKIKIPVLVMHGEDDRLVDMNGSLEFYRNCSSPDKELQIYAGLYHEIFNESVASQEKVLADLRRWVLAHLPAPPVTAPVRAGEPKKD